MTPPERMDLALCGGYEWIEGETCDECGHETPGKWVPVEMPEIGCQTRHEARFGEMCREMLESLRQRTLLLMAEMAKERASHRDFLDGPFWPTARRGATVNIPMPTRYKAPQ